MHSSIVSIREKKKEEAIRKAKKYLSNLNLKRYRAILFGSFARGDFDFASDIDLLIISDELPEDINERQSFLNIKRWDTPEIEPIGWTEREFNTRRLKKDPFIKILQEEGIEI